jgi:hypothetical protein
MFVADAEGDLTAGTLYAAKMAQMDDTGGGLFKVTWIKLISAAEKDVAGALSTVKFDDIFDVVLLATGGCALVAGAGWRWRWCPAGGAMGDPAVHAFDGRARAGGGGSPLLAGCSSAAPAPLADCSAASPAIPHPPRAQATTCARRPPTGR